MPKNKPKNLSNPLSLLVLILPIMFDVEYIQITKKATNRINEVAMPAIMPLSIYFFANGKQKGNA